MTATVDRKLKDKISDIMIMLGIPLLVAMVGWMMNTIDTIRDDGEQNSKDIIELRYKDADRKRENTRDSIYCIELDIRLNDVERIISSKLEATLPENKYHLTPPR